MAWTTPSTWVAGAVLTAAQLNAQVRDNMKAIGDPWTSWTPTWTAATSNPVLGNGSKTGGYSAAGKKVDFWVRIVMGSTTTYGTGQWRLDLPVSEEAYRWTFTGVMIDTSATATYPLFVSRTAASQLSLYRVTAVAGDPLGNVTSTAPFTWANTDELFISGTYEAA
jgi:hypothetical protein